MAAVFIPVGFMKGPAGVFYKQFAVTLATCDFNISCERTNPESRIVRFVF